MEFRSCIKDECGAIIGWCDEYSDEEVEEYLENHPECYRSCECIGGLNI